MATSREPIMGGKDSHSATDRGVPLDRTRFLCLLDHGSRNVGYFCWLPAAKIDLSLDCAQQIIRRKRRWRRFSGQAVRA